ncbi:slipin family protein [Frankia sp. CNm7]|uniref:Slipin family protein n=1 Tax=Frankia nepalensis TaxID=1836974 RepID=A0A937RJT5_9ACTN|nr:slipin family protein [Frankia nepalensis]MBL7500128.1 slipin family protein [Frankia nepalensis]MBL7511160.1 slipin family protein [Frankia nepalensis]MBL7517839.1 slipin family protein [Frankia nepalensis]MBL7631572.1 slipin family protein [Frankia nepalensis]
MRIRRTYLTVLEYQRAVRFHDGRLSRVLEPGRHRYQVRRDSHVTVDLRPRMLTVPGQEILTSDGVGVRVSLLARWKITSPTVYVSASTSAEVELYALLQVAARQTVGERAAESIVTDRSALGQAVLTAALALEPARLGIEVELVDVRDVMFPGEVRRAFSQVVLAREEARANLERARGEVAAMRALANAARMARGNPELMTLRTLQTIAESNASVVVLPGAVTAPATQAAIIDALPTDPRPATDQPG